MSTTSSAAVIPSVRLTSLDQFRGYTMLGMLLVNYLGSYLVCPRILKHTHDYCSYADTIMPHFLFAAGFAMRLSLGRRLEAGGKMPWGRAVRRILGLALVAIAWYAYRDLSGIIQQFMTRPPGEVFYRLFKRELVQTLLHIAVTSLWILPVIVSSWKVRVSYMVVSGLLHIWLSWWFNFDWVYADPKGIEGGPLGFLTWVVPALCGTLACDAVRASGPAAATRIAKYGVGVMLLGWLMSAPTVLYNVHGDQTSSVQSTLASVQSADVANHPDGQSKRESALPEVKKQEQNPSASQYALDPVIPSLQRLRSWTERLSSRHLFHRQTSNFASGITG